MKEYDFTCRRPMHGAEEYAAGATRRLSITDALHLVRSGALEPKGKEAEKAVRDALGNDADAAFGVQRVSDAAMDANNEQAAADGAQPRPAKSGQADGRASAKAAGNAPRNKADVTEPAPGTVHAGEPGVEQVGDGAASGDGAGAAAATGDAEVVKTEDAASAPATTAPAASAKAAAPAAARPKRRR